MKIKKIGYFFGSGVVFLSLFLLKINKTKAAAAGCDPSAWFFCNPVSVGTIVQAGEQLLGIILGLISSIALLLIIISGMMYMTSAGNEERIASSKRILSGAAIGLIIALLAYGLLHVIMTVLGM